MQISKAFNQHATAKKTNKIFTYERFNVANRIAYLYWSALSSWPVSSDNCYLLHTSDIYDMSQQIRAYSGSYVII